MRVTVLCLSLCVWLSPAAARELKIATWNLGWLTSRAAGDPALPPNVTPKTAADLALLAGYAEKLDADVVALQGVDDVPTAQQVFPAGRYSVTLAEDDVLQHTGFAIRTGLAAASNPDLAALDIYPQARLHLRAGADVTLHVGRTVLRLLSVHLKSGCRDAPLTSDRPACAALVRQADVLHGWIGARQAEGIAFLVLGDFGRVMEGADDFGPRLGPDLRRATAGRASPCWGPAAFTDHILLGGSAPEWMQPDSLRVMIYRETGPGTQQDWRQRLSGHCPVSVRLTLPD